MSDQILFQMWVVISAIRTCHHRTRLELIANNKVQKKVWMYIQKDDKCLKSLLVRSDALCAGVREWNRKYDDLNWKYIIFRKCIHTTIDTKLR